MNKINSLCFLFLAFSVLLGVNSGCWGGSNQLGPTPTSWPTPTINELISGFNSQDPDQRADAADNVMAYSHSEMEKAQLRPYLVKSLSDPDGQVRVFATQSLYQLDIYDEQAVQILISRLNNTHYQYAEFELRTTIQAIEQFADHAQEATPALIGELRTPIAHEKIAAANALGAIGDPVAIPYLLLIVLSSNESWVRSEVADALAEYGPEARCAVPHLVPLLDDPENEISSSAATAINQAADNGFEYRIVNATKEWWQETGQYESWPACPNGLNGEVILPP